MATNLSTGSQHADAGQLPSAARSPEPSQTEVTFPVTGMTCASCVRRIERRLGKVDGVRDVNVNLATEKARVVFNPGLIGLPDLVAAVEKAGYGVGELPEVATLSPSSVGVAPTPSTRVTPVREGGEQAAHLPLSAPEMMSGRG